MPASSLIRPHAGQATLVVVVHPHCTCSRATIGELAELMARTRTGLTAYVLFTKLAGFDDRWAETDLWRSANAIPGVVAIRDELGNESRRFGASTSGQTMLYGPDGVLRFSGGITSARGHFGDNAGLSAVLSLVDSDSSDRTASPVFGCPLFDRESRCGNGLAPCRSKET